MWIETRANKRGYVSTSAWVWSLGGLGTVRGYDAALHLVVLEGLEDLREMEDLRGLEDLRELEVLRYE